MVSTATPGPSGGTPFGFSEQLEVGRGAENYNEWIASQFKPYVGRRVLEVGCGIGNLARFWTDRELLVGIDPEQGCVEKCKERFGTQPNLQFMRDEVGAPDWIARWKENRFDTLIAVNVLEHIRDDLGALRGWREIVATGGGGHVCIFVPAFEFAFSAFDRRYGHFRRYTKESLRDKLLDAGLDIEVLRYFNMAGLAAWWATFVLLRRKDPSNEQIGIYDKVIVPLMRRIESAVTPPFGNSVVAVCRVKP
jgi:SAM-dependent methyltransferase